MTATTARASAPGDPTAGPVAARRRLMGGGVSVHATGVRTPGELEAVLSRLAAWASRLTRFDPGSELMRLNATPGGRATVGPTLAAVLDWAREAESLTDGLVDVALLDARLAAEARPGGRPAVPACRSWALERGPRSSAVSRGAGLRFDLDGVAKGWLADRALQIAPGRSALVDADGDVALRVAGDDVWGVGIADPRQPGGLLGVLAFRAGEGPARLGVATSGTSVHRWVRGSAVAHHIIDPRTLRPAATDLVQATVVAGSARLAEALAKAAVIVGADRAPSLLDRPGALGALLLPEHGPAAEIGGIARWLA